jgi:diguanylate cyclase (GGDEF)-like protein
MRYLFKDGTQAPHLFTALRFDYDGRPGFVGMGIDISDRKRMEEELRRETALFEAMVQNAPDGIVVVDRANRRIIHNQRLKEMWGVPNEIAADPDAGRLLEFVRHRTKDPDEFIAKVRWLFGHPEETSSDEVELVDGTILLRISGPVVGDDGRNYGRIWTFRDITDYRRVERRLRHLATHDGLTGLPNRSLIEQRIEQSIAQARRAGRIFAVLYVDLDRFKVINDGYGHAFGDAVLKAVGECLVDLVRPGDTVARHGGDEFLILLPEPSEPADATAVAQRIVDQLAQPVIATGREVHVSGSVGVSVFPRDGLTCQELIAHADAAMYRAKGQPRQEWG